MSRLRDNLKPHLCGKYNINTGGGTNPIGAEQISQSQQINFSPEKRSMGLAGNASVSFPLHSIEDEEEEMIKNMPWIKVSTFVC